MHNSYNLGSLWVPYLITWYTNTFIFWFVRKIYLTFLTNLTVHVNSLRPSDAYLRQWNYHHWFRWWLVAWSVPSHYLNQCWNIVNWTLGIKFQWNLNQNQYIFIQENAFENVVCEMAPISSRPQCVNSLALSFTRSGAGTVVMKIVTCIYTSQGIVGLGFQIVNHTIYWSYRKISNIRQNLMILILSCSCLCPIQSARC